LKTVSFLLHSEHGFAQSPYQEITKEEYEKKISRLKPVESIKNGEVLSELECANGVCPVK